MKPLKPILIMLVLIGLSQTAWAKYSGGSGTPSSPYIINSPADLIAMAGNTEDYTSHFLQLIYNNKAPFNGR